MQFILLHKTRILSAFFLFNILLNTFSFNLIYKNFKENQEYIYLNFCKNRDKPITICGGKCYLRNEFSQEKERKSSRARTEISFLIFFDNAQEIEYTPVNYTLIVNKHIPYLNSYYQINSDDIEHPPQFI